MANRKKVNNEEKFEEVVKTLDPDLYYLWKLLGDMGVNYYSAAKQIIATERVISGNGFGKIIISIQNGKIESIKTEQVERLD